MNQTSSIITGGMTVTAATIVPVVNWAFNGFARPIPESVPYLIAAVVVTVAHLVVNLVNNWMANKNKPADSPVTQDQPVVQPTDKAVP